jgi:hypothetical protein
MRTLAAKHFQSHFLLLCVLIGWRLIHPVARLGGREVYTCSSLPLNWAASSPVFSRKGLRLAIDASPMTPESQTSANSSSETDCPDFLQDIKIAS